MRGAKEVRTLELDVLANDEESSTALGTAGTAVAEAPEATTAASKNVTESEAADKRYRQALGRARRALRLVANTVSEASWQAAITTTDQVHELEKELGGNQTRERVLRDLAKGESWTKSTLKKRAGTVEWLTKKGLTHVAMTPATGFHQVADIVHCGLTDAEKTELIQEVYTHDSGKGAVRHTVRQVRDLIADRRPNSADVPQGAGSPSGIEHPWGAQHLPGDAAEVILRRVLTTKGNVLSVLDTDGTVLDAARRAFPYCDHRGVDVVITAGVADRHGGQVAALDVESLDVGASVPSGWTAGVAVVVAPKAGTIAATGVGGMSRETHGFAGRPYADALAVAVKRTVAVLAPGGVIVAVTRASEAQSHFDAEFEVGRVLHSIADIEFVGRAVIVRPVTPRRTKAGLPHVDTTFHQVLVFRRATRSAT